MSSTPDFRIGKDAMAQLPVCSPICAAHPERFGGDWIEAASARRHGNMAYQQIQGTRPQTLAYGLSDSRLT